MDGLWSDVRVAVRFLARKPIVTVLAVVSLALGIGVNSSIFGLVNAALLQDPPAVRPGQLVEVYSSDSGGYKWATSSYLDYVDLRDRNTVLAELAAFRTGIATYDQDGETELLFGEEVSGNYFDLLGIQPALGRGFTREETAAPGQGPVLVLSHGFWQRRMGGDAGVLGQTLELNGVPLTVVGVAPPALKGDLPAIEVDYFVPITMHDRMAENPRLDRRGSRSLFLRGRLADGVTAEAAQAQLGQIMATLGEAYPETNEDRTISVVPSREVLINPGIDGPVKGVAGLLMAIVGLVLLIACSNIANLLLARAADRRKEIAIRLAIGSGRWRLIRQLLIESLLLAATGGLLGLVLASWTTRLITSFQPPLPVPINLDLGLDLRVLLFTFAVTVVTGVVCGLAPALQATRTDLVTALKDETASMGTRFRRFGLRNVLVVGQVMVSTLLLIGAGLFVRSLGQAHTIDPGFSLERGVATTVMLGMGNRYSEEEGRVFLDRLKERAEALPGVRSAAYVEYLPLSLSVSREDFQPEGLEVTEDTMPGVNVSEAGAGYFSTMGIELVAGRDFSVSDTPDGPRAVIVNETLARTYWPGENPVGKRMRFDLEEPWREVVGVAADGKYVSLGEEPKAFAYRNLEQDYSSMVTLLLASDRDEVGLQSDLHRLIDELDPNLAIFEQRLMSDHLSTILFPARMGAALLTAFGMLGLILAAVGLYGVVAYAVSRRTREVGIRVALGAGRGDVIRLMVSEGMMMVWIGLALGIGVALLATRALSSLLYGITPSDPVTFISVAVLLAAVALAANLIPARRALRIAPMQALRYE